MNSVNFKIYGLAVIHYEYRELPVQNFRDGEFDPGSEWTLAAWLGMQVERSLRWEWRKGE